MSSQPVHNHRAALVFQDINISRMDGIRDGYRVDAFSPGINLIHGPNGVGKSRTAAALQALIWPETSSDRAEIVGNVLVSEDEWMIDLDLGKVRYQKNGVPDASQGILGLSDPHRDRYLLTLQDLLRVENKNFAREIQTEAAGGYDFGRVREEMNIRSVSRAFRPSQPVKSLDDARNEINDLQQQDKRLFQDEQSLVQLNADREASIGASTLVNELVAAGTYRDGCDVLAAARIARASFVDPIGRMLGDEYDRFQQLKLGLADENQKRQQRELERATLQKQLAEAGFAQAMPPDALIATLRKRRDDLHRQEAVVRQAAVEIEDSRALIASLRSRIGASVTDFQIKTLDISGLQELAQLSREWQQVRTTLQIQDELHGWLGKEKPQNRERLGTGVQLLSRYLRTTGAGVQTGSTSLVFFALIGASILLIVEALLLAVAVSPVLLALALLAVPLVWLALHTRSASGSAGEAERLRQEYLTLALDEPASWEIDNVSLVLTSLQVALMEAELDYQKATRWGDLEGKRQQTSTHVQQIAEQREAFFLKYGLALKEDVPESLEFLATALEGWRRASDQLVKATSRKATAEAETATTLVAINDGLERYGHELVASDAISADVCIDHLANRIEDARRLKSKLQQTGDLLGEEIEPRIAVLSHQVSDLFSHLGLEEGDEFSLRNLCDQIGACGDAQKTVERAKIKVDTAREMLREDAGYEHMSREEIDRAWSAARDLAERRDDLQARISEIEAEIGQARRQTNLEQAIGRESIALDGLSDGRQQDYGAAAARRVFEFIQNQNREVNRPPVFRAADHLFTAFTNGAYGLELDDSNEPEFIALDTATGRALALNELSSGTRVQLLLAVRLAFIEATERGPRLPIILDETLGNTDDTRAAEIVSATIEIARRGRQVFYFTAQRDEIGKWVTMLDALEEPVEWSVFDLANIRDKARADSISTFAWNPSIFAEFSVPDDTNHEQLFELFGVPIVDLWADHPNAVDLWYLVPEVPALVELRKRRVRTWGQYLALHRSQQLKGIWTVELHECAKARADVIETVCRAWQRGRPKPLTKECLRECGAITERFWEEVVQCAEQHHWNGALLIDALRNGEVGGFYEKTMTRLEDWFREYGIITDAEVVSEETIRAVAFSAAHVSIENGVIEAWEIDALLQSMTGEPVLLP